MNYKANEFVMAGARALAEELASLREALAAMRLERDAALAQLAAVTQQRDALREELIAVEWVLSGVRGWYCPRCLSKKTAGHTPDCQRQAALAQVRS